MECYVGENDTDVVMTTTETDAEFMARLRADEKLTYEDISAQINKEKLAKEDKTSEKGASPQKYGRNSRR